MVSRPHLRLCADVHGCSVLTCVRALCMYRRFACVHRGLVSRGARAKSPAASRRRRRRQCVEPPRTTVAAPFTRLHRRLQLRVVAPLWPAPSTATREPFFRSSSPPSTPSTGPSISPSAPGPQNPTSSSSTDRAALTYLRS